MTKEEFPKTYSKIPNVTPKVTKLKIILRINKIGVKNNIFFILLKMIVLSEMICHIVTYLLS